MSSQFMFDDSLQAERDLGINFWEKECPNTDALGVTIAGARRRQGGDRGSTPSTSPDRPSTSASNIRAG